jgi:hypothetical protein
MNFNSSYVLELPKNMPISREGDAVCNLTYVVMKSSNVYRVPDCWYILCRLLFHFTIYDYNSTAIPVRLLKNSSQNKTN